MKSHVICATAQIVFEGSVSLSLKARNPRNNLCHADILPVDITENETLQTARISKLINLNKLYITGTL